MIKDKLYNYFSINHADYDFNLCEEKEDFLQGLEKSTPEKVKKFHTKGTNYHLKYNNIVSHFTLCINRAILCTTDYCDFSLWEFVEFLKNLAYYDNKLLMCSFHDEGQFFILTAFPYGENSLRISVFNSPEYNDYKCCVDIIINKDTFLAQIKDILEKAIKHTQKLDKGHPNRYVNIMQSALDALEQYFNNSVTFKKSYDIPKHFRVFDIAYKNLDGIWEFCACLDDDEKADTNYWEKQKKEGKILDYDYYEQYAESCYRYDYDLQKLFRLTREDVRKKISPCMYERVEKQNWVYCRDTNKWYSTNEIMPKPEKIVGVIWTELDYDIEFDTESISITEDEQIKNYIENSYDKNGALLPDKDDWGWLTCYVVIRNSCKTVCNIELDYRENQNIRAALEKMKTQEYVRFDLKSNGNKMHLWRETYSNSDDVNIAAACYEKQNGDCTKDNQLYFFTASKDFIDCLISALDEIENRINIMKNVLKSAETLEIDEKLELSKGYDDKIEYLENFVGDYACVSCTYGNWGIINKSFEWVIKPKEVAIHGKKHPKWGQEILGIIKRFRHLHNIDGKFFIAKKHDGKQLVIDINGDLQIPHASDKIYYTYLNNELYFAAVDYNKTYFTNAKGEDILTVDFPIGEKFWLFDEVIIVSKDNKYGLLDWQGRVKLDFIFSEINPDKNNLDFIPVKYIDKWGFINKNGKVYDMKIQDKSEADSKYFQAE